MKRMIPSLCLLITTTIDGANILGEVLLSDERGISLPNNKLDLSVKPKDVSASSISNEMKSSAQEL